jgi:hypothetical protein
MSLRLRVSTILFGVALVVVLGAGSAAGGGAQTQAETPVSGGTLNLVAEKATNTLNPYDGGHFRAGPSSRRRRSSRAPSTRRRTAASSRSS